MRRAIAVVIMWVGVAIAPADAMAVSYSGTNNADQIVIGCANRGGTGNRMWLCVNGTFTQLDTTCDMDEDLYIYALSGNDEVTAVASYDYYDCSGLATWNPIGLGGYKLYVSGSIGDDTILGGNESGDVAFHGGSNNDMVVGFAYSGSYNINTGGSGDDVVVNDGYAANLDCGDNDDCCEDFDGGWYEGGFAAGSGADWCALHGGDEGDTSGCDDLMDGEGTCLVFR